MSDVINEVLEINEDTQEGKFLTFPLDNATYAIEIKFVTEIIGIQPITQMPDMPYYVKGIINLRGKIIPVVDIRLKFKKEPKDYDERTCIIVIDINNTSLGLIVDNVSEVLNIPDENIVEPPDMNKEFNNRFIKAIGKIGNNVDLILSCEEIIKDSI